MRELKILLIGQPNVGKSSLLNALVGSRVIVSNYPGTTVEITQAEKIFGGTKINFVDTPGIYSISDRSEEEKVTEKALFKEKADGVIVIADAVSLERSLYIVLQILEAQVPTVLALNFVEEAGKKGTEIDCEKLEKILQIPVVSINPLIKKGIGKLIGSVLKIKKLPKRTFAIEYDDDIEKAINKVSSNIKNTLPRRFIALRVLEKDEDFYEYLKNKKVIRKIKEDLKDHPKVAEDISITRYGTASFIAGKVTEIIPLEKEERLEKKIDQIFLHRIWGPLTTGLSLFLLFGILLKLGNWTQGLLTGWAENLLSSFGETYSFFSIILVQGLTGIVAGISIALPYVFLFYLLLGLLEDIGLLSRFVVNTERFLKKLGLPGKSFIPLVLGLGCTVPATKATRVLASSKEQFLTASLFAFVPCSSRIAIIMGIVGFYGGAKLAFSVFITLLITGLIWAFGIKKIFSLKSEPLFLELPPYRKPLIRNVFAKSWVRMKDFVYIVVPLLAVGGIIYGVLNATGITVNIIKPLSPITIWLVLPSITIIPLVFGFLQKDLTGAMLVSVLGSDILSVLSPLQLYTFGLASTIGIPCIIALGMLYKEFGLKKSLILTVSSIIYGLLVAGLIGRIIYFLF
jgi:ferrous iron transport protein B